MNNGRVNIIGPNNVDRFLLYEQVVPKKTTNYSNALVGNFQQNQVSKLFFSANNIDFLQNKMIEGVFNKSNGNYKIGRQDDDVLKTIMRALYLQFSKNLNTNIREQISELNKPYGGLGISILSTPKGVMSDHQAKKKNVGGEILCEVF